MKAAGLPRKGRVNGKQIGNARLILRKNDAVVAVRHGALEFAHNDVGRVDDGDGSVLVLIRLAHLFQGVLQARDLRAEFADIRFGYDEGLPETIVEAHGDIPRKLQMLLLILSDGHEVRAEKKDIRRHQHGIGEKARIDIILVFSGFILELGHSVQLADIGHTCISDEGVKTKDLNNVASPLTYI